MSGIKGVELRRRGRAAWGNVGLRPEGSGALARRVVKLADVREESCAPFALADFTAAVSDASGTLRC